MGFGTSGSFLLLGLAAFVALGTLHGAVSNTTEQLSDAREDTREHRIETAGTDVLVAEVVRNDTAGTLTIRMNNTGETALVVDDTDVLVDGRYVDLSEFETVEVDGGQATVWRPGQQLELVDEGWTNAARRVKAVVGGGIADTAEVATVS